ncbi:hypothetical protein TUM19329_25160 [Legionella antarctica]|uniref:Uncharacterized protein n=1 Tax=Legionella antarctica TaxID=2708020 RepID=A0A6F8T635_9GAMM|nr:hypothetical protein [Legionella antarctica]BCA96155.1 hypothetical protein TUM19329_25160 [Legionella antarctica]
MLLERRFENFQKKYNQILNADQKQFTTYEELKSFIFSKITYPPKEGMGFEFYFDTHKKKLIFSIAGGIHNGCASEILYFFRNYDDQALWYLYSDSGQTIRTFELNIEKAGDKLLGDFETFIANPQPRKIQIQSFSHSDGKDYIPPKHYKKQPEISKDNNPPSSFNTQTLIKFAGLFALGAGALVLANKFIKSPEQNNILTL